LNNPDHSFPKANCDCKIKNKYTQKKTHQKDFLGFRSSSNNDCDIEFQSNEYLTQPGFGIDREWLFEAVRSVRFDFENAIAGTP
jgi:hypothetical protein